MRVGLVCPYSFDVPGGVQFHIRDLAEALISRGHQVSVLAPAEDETPVPDYVVRTGRSVPIHYNGSVARLNFGPLTNTRTRRWLADGQFDLLHIHEPFAPSLGMLALWAARGAIVATFHSSIARSRAMRTAFPLVRPSLEKIAAAIAVSEDARRTVMEHLGADAVIIPNGVFADAFDVPADPRWTGTPARPVFAFLGRMDETRKGLPCLLQAVPRVLDRLPGARFVLAGRGETAPELAALGPLAASVEVLGPVSEADKAALLASCSAYVAPQLGGESFGIVLVEAMAAGAPVIASDLGAFRRVLDEGALGRLFPVGDAAGLAAQMVAAVTQAEATRAVAAQARAAARRYDWSVVTDQILTVYELAAGGGVATDPAAVM